MKNYWNLRFFILLFCYMLTTQGMKECSMGERIASHVLKRAKTIRGMMLRLVLLAFFLSIFLANEFVLLMMFPITLSVFSRIQNSKGSLLHTLVLISLSVSFGGMLLPFGNFQNLYLYMEYGYALPKFFQIMLPFSLLGLGLLILYSVSFQRQDRLELSQPEGKNMVKKREFYFYLFCFFLTILLSLPRIPEFWLLPFVLLILVGIYVFDRGLYQRTDYRPLILFFLLCFISGGLEGLDGVYITMLEKLRGYETWASLFLSQIMGNVPASVLLSRFTTNGRNLIVGCNLGGLGVFWASMTGVWGLRLYGKLQHGDLKKYLLHYSYLSFQFLFAMIFLALFTGNL